MKARILIAEDSASIRSMLQAVLSEAGYEIVTAENGIEAIQKTYRDCPQLILLDIFMPKMNGYQVCRLLKNDPLTARIPIIILTSAEGKGDKFWSMQTGADEFLIKDAQLLENIGQTIAKNLKNQENYPQDTQKKAAGPNKVMEESEILSKLSSLLDRELYRSTLDKKTLQVAVEGLMEGLLILDTTFKITLFNPALQQMTNCSEKQAIDKKCCEIFNQSLCREQCYFAPVFSQEKNVADAEAVLRGQGNTLIPVSISIALLRGDQDQVVSALCVLKDIGKLKEIEKMKSDFVSMVTHELRSPLAIIESIAESILDGTVESEEEREEFLTRIRDNAQRLIGLVNDLLDLSKLELGAVQLSLDEIDFGAIAQRCVSGIQMLASKKNVEVRSIVSNGFPKQITADPNRVEQVLINLLSNAVKFTPEKGRITVSLDEEGQNVKCSVADTGTGIPKDSLEKIFDKFQQIHDRDARQKGGTGLGLAVVKTIIEAHQGKIWCESEIGKGSCFIFTIPKLLKSEG